MLVKPGCPRCAGPLEDATEIRWTAPRIATWIVGYCPRCSFKFRRDLETEEYASFTWAPLCHICDSQVELDQGESDQESRLYRCPGHPDEAWEYRSDEDWQWRGNPSSPSA
jgi:hypothetical protein